MRLVVGVLTTLVAVGAPARAATQAGLDYASLSLRGVDTMQVLVSASPLRSGEEVDTSEVRTSVELALRQLGITVLPPTGYVSGFGHFGVVGVDVSALEIIPHGAGVEGYAFCVSVNVTQGVRLIRPDSIETFAVTWESRKAVDLVDPGRPLTSGVLDEVRGEVSELANAWLAANRKR